MSSIKWLLETLEDFAFTEADKQHLADLLAQSYLLAKAQAYQKAIATTQHVVTIHKPWQPGENDVKHAQQWASEQVGSIVSTYEEALQQALERMSEEQTTEGFFDKAKDKLAAIGLWMANFLGWKTKQIANHTWSTGSNDGTEQFIEDVLDKDKTDEVVDDGLIQVRVRIVPSKSSSDYCRDYAGKSYGLEEYKSLDVTFPAHINCIHSAEVYTVNARNAKENVQLIDLLVDSEEKACEPL